MNLGFFLNTIYSYNVGRKPTIQAGSLLVEEEDRNHWSSPVHNLQNNLTPFDEERGNRHIYGINNMGQV